MNFWNQIFVVSLSFISFSVLAMDRPIQIISDIDDTLLKTHVENKLEAAVSVLKKPQPFLGMNSLFNEIIQSSRFNESKMNYVSGSAQFLKERLNQFLIQNHFPFGSLFLTTPKEWVNQQTTEFKIRTISEIMSLKKIDTLFFGDNTQKDPEIYLEILKQFPESVKNIYIHLISKKNQEIESNQIFYYITPVEVAFNEFLNNRIELEQLKKVIDVFHQLPQSQFDQLIPLWGFCPLSLKELPNLFQEAFNEGNLNPYLMEVRSLAGKILLGCSNRKYITQPTQEM